eukprot:5711662-Pleurochrysis_carterae.AAC.7
MKAESDHARLVRKALMLGNERQGGKRVRAKGPSQTVRLSLGRCVVASLWVRAAARRLQGGAVEEVLVEEDDGVAERVEQLRAQRRRERACARQLRMRGDTRCEVTRGAPAIRCFGAAGDSRGPGGGADGTGHGEGEGERV